MQTDLYCIYGTICTANRNTLVFVYLFYFFVIYSLTFHILRKHYNDSNDGSVIWKEYGRFVHASGTDAMKISGCIDLILLLGLAVNFFPVNNLTEK